MCLVEILVVCLMECFHITKSLLDLLLNYNVLDLLWQLKIAYIGVMKEVVG